MALFCFPAPSLFYLMKYLFLVISMQLYVPDRCSAEYLLFKRCFFKKFIYFRNWLFSHEQSNTYTHSQHMNPLVLTLQSFSCEHHCWIANVCMCVCEWQRRVSDERGELIVMLCWIQMRERQAEFWSGCLLSFFRSPSLSISQSENTSEKCVFLNQWGCH